MTVKQLNYKLQIIRDHTRPKIWFRLPYVGKTGELLVKSCTEKIRRQLKIPVNFIVIYKTTKISYSIPNKDRILDLSRSNLVYEITCPGCNQRDIGKTERCLAENLSEHSSNFANSAVANHFVNCQHVNYFINLNNFFDRFGDSSSFKDSTIFNNFINNNCKILHGSYSLTHSQLLLLEALFIKFNMFELHCGLKASKELTLFP